MTSKPTATDRKELSSRVAAAQRQADTAKRAAKLAKLALRRAKDKFKKAKRAAKKLKKTLKGLKAEAAAMGAASSAPRRPAPKTTSPRSRQMPGAPPVQEPVEPGAAVSEAPPPADPAAQ